jgi:hypothetical protein
MVTALCTDVLTKHSHRVCVQQSSAADTSAPYVDTCLLLSSLPRLIATLCIYELRVNVLLLLPTIYATGMYLYMITASAAFVPPVMPLPGVVEAEHFELGGQGIAYYNVYKEDHSEPISALNNALRNTLISVELLDKANPALLEYVVGYTAANEWMSYKVLVPPPLLSG